MLLQKSNRRYVVLVAASLSLLTMLGPQSAGAQFMPGVPAPTIWTPPVPRVSAPQSDEETVLFTDMKVTSKMLTIAESHVLASKTQYELAAKLLETHIHVLRATEMADGLEMAATLNNLGWMQEHLGQIKEAEQSYLQALKVLLPRTRYVAQAAVIKYNLGDMYMVEHQFLSALHYYRQALQDLSSTPNPDQQAIQQIQRKYDAVRRLVIAEAGD